MPRITDAYFRISDTRLDHIRTTVRLSPEVRAAVERLRRERHISLSDAVNESLPTLARRLTL